MTPIAQRLISYLERSNYVTFRGAWREGFTDESVRAVFAEAKLAFYSTTRGVWVPDVGTYDWIVKQKFGACASN